MSPTVSGVSVTVTLLALLLLATPLGAQEEERILTGVEYYLPGGALLHVEMPDLDTVSRVLARCGQTADVLAGRYAQEGGPRPEALKILFEVLGASMDGPLSLTLYDEVVPGRSPRTPFVVSVTSRRKGDHLKTAGEKLLRGLLVPALADEVKEEQVMGLSVLHLRRKGFDLYASGARGYLIYTSSALLMGRVLKEMQGPSVHTLSYDEVFARARAEAAKAAGGKPHGFLYLKDATLLPGLARLGADAAWGVLTATESGFIDEACIQAAASGPLGQLKPYDLVPGAWAESHGDRGWLGALVQPGGVRGLAIAVLGDDVSPFLGNLDKLATGQVEALFPAGGAPVLRIRLREGADPAAAVGMLGNMARREGNVLLLSTDHEALAAQAVGEDRDYIEKLGAVAKGPLHLFLAALGSEAAPAGRNTAWRFHARPASPEAPGEVTITCGEAEAGPFQVLLASLFR